MNIVELRVGNWINNYGVLTQVDREKHFVKPYYLDNAEPVPLTEDWLLKFGLDEDLEFNHMGSIDVKNRGSIVYNNGEGFLKKGIHIYSGLGDSDSYGFTANVEYVHQFQNLYFALTGEELKLQE